MSTNFGDLQKTRTEILNNVNALPGDTTQDKINSMSLNDYANFQKTFNTLIDGSNNLTGYSSTWFPYATTDYKQIGTYSFNGQDDLMTQVGGGLHTAKSCAFSVIHQKSKNMNLVKPSDKHKNTYQMTIYVGDFKGNLNTLTDFEQLESANKQIDPNTGLPVNPINTTNMAITVEIQGFFKIDNAGYYKFDYKSMPGISNVYGWIGDESISMYKTENAYLTPTKNSFRRFVSSNTYIPFRIIYGSTVGVTLPIRIVKPGENKPCSIDWVGDQYGGSSAYFALVENTPNDTKKGLFKCYGFDGQLSDFSEYGGEDYNSQNNVSTTVVQLFKIDAGGDSGNYLMADAKGGGDLIIYDKNDNPLKTLITSTNKMRIHYALSLDDSTTQKTENHKMMRTNTGRMELSYMDLSLFDPNVNSYKLSSVPDWVQDKRTNSNVIPSIYTQAPNKIFVKMTNQQVMYSPAAQLKLYFDANGSLILEAGIYVSNTTNKGVKYTKVENNYNIYQYQLDNRSNKLFYANDYEKSIREVPIDLQQLSNTYASPVNDLFPSLGQNYKITDRTEQNDCQTQCKNDPSCEYFFRVTGIKDSKEKCVLSNGVPLEVSATHPEYKSSQLTIRGKRINVAGDPNFEKLVYDPNGYSKKSDYKIQNLPINADTKAGNIGDYELNQIVQASQIRFNGQQSEVIVGTDDKTKPMQTPVVQGFSLYRSGNIIEGNEMMNAVNKINQNESKLAVYQQTQNKINQTAKDISGVMTDLSTNWWMMRDYEKNNRNSGDKYDFSNNLYSGTDANGGISLYSLSKDTSKEKAIMDDLNTYMIEENNMNMIATLTLATLVIGAIFIAKGANGSAS